MVNFWKGNEDGFNLIQTKNPETIYFIFDAFKIYLGDKELSNNNTTELTNYELYVEEAEKSTVWYPGEIEPPKPTYDTDKTYLTISANAGRNIEFGHHISGMTQVDWGDGTVDNNKSHVYGVEGDYDIIISHTADSDIQFTGNDVILKAKSLGKNASTSLARCFGNNFNLNEIYPNIFDNCNANIQDFTSCFAGSKITSIPAGLFDKFTNAKLFDECFSQTSITSIPAGLFSKTIATSFSRCFYRCLNLNEIKGEIFPSTTISLGECFNMAESLETIPANLFSSCVNAENFSQSLQGLIKLRHLPAGIFDNNTEALSFENLLTNNVSLETSPPGLFDNNTKAKNFNNCFNGCTSIIHEYNCTSPELPKIWEREGVSGEGFAANTNLSFKETVIIDWGGLSDEHTRTIFTTKSNTVGIRFTSVESNAFIDWGDGSITPNLKTGSEWNDHTYTDGISEHTVMIRGSYVVYFYDSIGSNNCAAFKNINKLIQLGGTNNSYNCSFYDSTLKEIDGNALKYFKGNNMSGCFSRSNITSIPSGLFDNCVNVTNFARCFIGCITLSSTPTGLFDKCINVTDFGGCFYGCKINHVYNLTSEGLPELWDRSGNNGAVRVMYYQDFAYASHETFRSSVPIQWAGTARMQKLVVELIDNNQFINDAVVMVGNTLLKNVGDGQYSGKAKSASSSEPLVINGIEEQIIPIAGQHCKLYTIHKNSDNIPRQWDGLSFLDTENVYTIVNEVDGIWKKRLIRENQTIVGDVTFNGVREAVRVSKNNYGSKGFKFYSGDLLYYVDPLLFVNCTKSTNFTNCFKYSSLKSIPSGLFDNCTAAEDFFECFSECTSLTSIPAGLFDNCRYADNFNYCFNACSSLASIPAGLFDKNVNATGFNNTFNACSSLTSIPAGLFDKNVNVTGFSSCFKNCSSLTSIPVGLFDKNVKSWGFGGCFNNCSSLNQPYNCTSPSLPKLWERDGTNGAVKVSQFMNFATNAPETFRSTVIIDWGGTMLPEEPEIPDTSGSKTYMVFTVNNNQTVNLHPKMDGITYVDWGDGTVGISKSHTYTTGGDYNVIITHTENSSFEWYNSKFLKEAKSIGKLNNKTSFSNSFSHCTSLTTIHQGLFDNCINDNLGNFESCFMGCSSLTSIPSGLFDKCVNAISFTNCFSDCSLTSIPVGLFDKCVNATHFDTCFSGCRSLTSIPVGLFDKCVNAVIFRNCFYGCRSLTSIPVGLFNKNVNATNLNCFGNCSSLTSIPAGLFDTNINVTNFNNCFDGCSALSSIPAGLFDKNVNVGEFNHTFRTCSSLTSIPAGLFDKNVNVTSFYGCFYKCYLTSIPVGLFDKNVNAINFEECFCYAWQLDQLYNCTSPSLPKLWERDGTNGAVAVTSYSDFAEYAHATFKSSVPINWGGTMISGQYIKFFIIKDAQWVNNGVVTVNDIECTMDANLVFKTNKKITGAYSIKLDGVEIKTGTVYETNNDIDLGIIFVGDNSAILQLTTYDFTNGLPSNWVEGIAYTHVSTDANRWSYVDGYGWESGSKGVNNGTSDFILNTSGEVTITYHQSAETGYDCFQIMRGETILFKDNNVYDKDKTIVLSLDNDIFRYRKDSSANSGRDAVWIKKISCYDVEYPPKP